MSARGRRHGLLLSSSVAALLIGGGAPAAACYTGPFPFTNPGALSCVTVTGTSFSGNLVNSPSGLIAPGGPTGILVTGASTITGQLSNAGAITIDAGTGIRITANSVITNGLVNSGTVALASGEGGIGIRLDALSTFAGGISNGGTISGGGAFHTGISVANVAAFSGGVANSGTISAASRGISVTGSGTETFLGGISISNSGSILVAGGGGGKGGKGGKGADHGIAVNNLAFFGSGLGIASAGSITTDGTGISVQDVSTFMGGISNGGTISAQVEGITVIGFGGTFAGGIFNSGTVSATFGGAINVSGFATFSSGITNNGLIAATSNAAIRVTGVSAFSGGIVNNHGSISAGTNGIQIGLSCSHGCVSVSTFAGGVTNSGSIAASGFGIAAMAVGAFSEGVLNSGTVSANIGIGIGFVRPSHPPTTTAFVMAPVATFTGGVTNSGIVTAGSAGIWVMAAGSFAGGITNAAGGVITAQNGIRVGFGLTSSGAYAVSNFSGGITNHGMITATRTGISVGNVSTFSGRISNAGTIVANSGGGIHVDTVGTFSGGISNSGAILGDGFLSKSRGAIYVGSVAAFEGGITNSGTISAGPLDGILVEFVNTFSGGISNSGSIQGDATITKRLGVIHIEVDVFDGGVTNSGTLTGVNGGIYVLAGTFLGGITNSGRISAQTGIIVDSVASFDGHVANSGTISAVGAAVDLTRAATGITVDQNAGLIGGTILLSPHGDTINVRGGTINGNIVGQNAGDTINFALGAGSFTYDAAYGFANVSQVNVNSGIVVLEGANQAGNVAVTGGVLQVGDAANPGATLAAPAVDVLGGALAGHGTVIGGVTIENGGTLAPGGSIGTLTVSGALTFNPGSRYAVQIAPGAGNNSATTVSGAPGTVTINGGTVVVTPQVGHYANDYVIITAAGGRSGTFTGVTVDGAFFGSMMLDYTTTPGDVLLDVNGYSLFALPPGASQNQQNVFNGINNAILAGNNLPSQFVNLVNLPASGLLNALAAFAGENSTGFFQGASQAGNSFLSLVLDPFLDGRFGAGGGFGVAMGFAAEEPPALSETPSAFASVMPVKAAPAPFQRVTTWAAGYDGAGQVAGDPSVGSHDTRATAAATAAGVDYRPDFDTIVGFALAGGGTSWNLAGGFGGGRSDMFQAGAYASHHWGGAYLSGAAAYDFHDVTTTRTVTVAGTDILQGRFGAEGVGARLEAGYRYATPWAGFTPYAAAQVQSIALPGYSEFASAGSNQFALSFAAQTATTKRTELGAWLDASTRLAGGALLTLYGRAAWAHDSGNTARASAIFQALPGSSFIVNGATPAPDSALVSAGAQYRLTSGWSLAAKLDGEFASGSSIYSGSAVLRKAW
jgi:uncharacterized protein with beta-barrel porin domain